MARAASDMVPGRETEEQAAELAALRRFLDISANTFSLSVAVCNSPALRDYLVARVREGHPDLAVVGLPRGCVDVYGEVTAQLGETDVRALFVAGIERSVSSASDDHPTLRSLNASRDLWESRFPCPVLFWMPAYVAALLPSHAPDFWRYRSHGFEFAASALTPELLQRAPLEGDLVFAINLDADHKQFRMAELEQRISEAGWPPAGALRTHVIMWMQELAFLYLWADESKKAEEILKKAVEVCEEGANFGIVANLLGSLGLVFRLRGDYDSAERIARESLALCTEADHPEVEASQLGNLASVLYARGDLVGAERHYREALAIDRRQGRPEREATRLGNLGHVAQAGENLDAAEGYYREALAIERRLGGLEGQASRLADLGDLARIRSDFDTADQLYREALRLSRDLEDQSGQANSLRSLCSIAQIKGDLEAAERYSCEALEISRRLGWLVGESVDLAQLGIVAGMRGDPDASDAYLHRSLEIERRLNRLESQAQRLSGLGLNAEARGERDAARRLWSEAATLYEGLGMTDEVEEMQRRLDDLSTT